MIAIENKYIPVIFSCKKNKNSIAKKIYEDQTAS